MISYMMWNEYEMTCSGYDFIHDCFYSGRFKCSPGQVQTLNCLNQMQALCLLVTYVCLSVLLGIKIGLQWFMCPYQASRTLCLHPLSHPPPPFPISINLFATILLARSMPVWLQRCLIPFHKLGLEEISASVAQVGHQLQDLENDVGVRLTKACCSWIGGPSKVLGNNKQAGKVGNQVLATSWKSLAPSWVQERPLQSLQELRRTRKWPGSPSCQLGRAAVTYSSTYWACQTLAKIQGWEKQWNRRCLSWWTEEVLNSRRSVNGLWWSSELFPRTAVSDL